MTVARIPLPSVTNALREVYFALQDKVPQLAFSTMTEDELWRELIACVLGSRVRYEVAYAAIERMDKLQLFSQSRRSSRFDQYERAVKSTLSEGCGPSRYPFARLRASHVRSAAERIYGRGDTLRSLLENADDTRSARRRLISEVPGLGPKQASLFLRNIGYTAEVAILDTHVLTYMGWVGLAEATISSVATVRTYGALEDAFMEHACSFGYTLECFDLAVWIVVRAAKEEKAIWGL